MQNMCTELKPCHKKISIIRVVTEFIPMTGGSITHIIELSNQIDPYLNSQVILAPDFGDKCKKYDKESKVKVIRVKYYHLCRKLHIPVLPLIDIIYAINVYYQLRKMKKPDIIHFHGISNVAFGSIICKLLRVPNIGMIHGSYSSSHKTNYFYEWLLCSLFKPDYAFILNDGTNIDIFKKAWKDRYTIVNHGINTNLFRPIKKNEYLIKKYCLGSYNFIILSISRLTDFKNIDLAIMAFAEFSKKYHVTDACFLILGDGPLRNELINLAKDLQVENNVVFLGEIAQEQIVKYISIGDVVVATSLQSNMNRSIQESLACEKAVIVFDSGGTVELIKHMENGLLVESGNISSFAEKLYLLYKNPQLREKLEKNARKSIIEERSWEKRIKQELDIYEKILCK